MEVEEAAPQPAVETVAEPVAQPLLATGEPALLPPQVRGARWRRPTTRLAPARTWCPETGYSPSLPESAKAERGCRCRGTQRRRATLPAERRRTRRSRRCSDVRLALCVGSGGAAPAQG